MKTKNDLQTSDNGRTIGQSLKRSGGRSDDNRLDEQRMKVEDSGGASASSRRTRSAGWGGGCTTTNGAGAGVAVCDVVAVYTGNNGRKGCLQVECFLSK